MGLVFFCVVVVDVCFSLFFLLNNDDDDDDDVVGVGCYLFLACLLACFFFYSN